MVYQLILCLLRGLALREFFIHHTTLTKLYLEKFWVRQGGVAHFPGVCLSSMACTLFYVPQMAHLFWAVVPTTALDLCCLLWAHSIAFLKFGL
jgi:hypothetical protein